MLVQRSRRPAGLCIGARFALYCVVPDDPNLDGSNRLNNQLSEIGYSPAAEPSVL